MEERFIYCSTGMTDWETWQVAAKDAYFINCQIEHPSTICQEEINYEDRITNVVDDIMVKLATDDETIHTDRLIDPYIEHPTDSNKIIGLFDLDEIENPLNEAYYCTQDWRDTNTGSDLSILTEAEAEAEGFDFGNDEEEE